jgi:SAM-dependent methyltransferase
MPAPYRFPEDYEYPDCDLCGSVCSPDGSPVVRNGVRVPNPRAILIERAKGTDCNLVECLNCGLRFFSPRPKWSVVKPMVAAEKEQAQRLFDTGSFLPVDDPVEQKANIHSYYTKMLADSAEVLGHIPRTMFEVGGLVGWFAVAARDFGVSWIDGCDLNPHGVDIARREHGLIGYEPGDFADYIPKRKYDFVVALDYLEHTYRPWQDLQKLAAMLEPGGVFLAKTFLDDLDVNHEQLAPPTHAIHWTTPVLRKAIERVGLTIKQFRMDYPRDHPYMPIIIAQKTQ